MTSGLFEIFFAKISFTWAVHRLEPKFLLLYFKVEHVLLVVICMTGCLPEVKVVYVWRHNLLVFILPVLFSDVLQTSTKSSARLHWTLDSPLLLSFEQGFEQGTASHRASIELTCKLLSD